MAVPCVNCGYLIDELDFEKVIQCPRCKLSPRAKMGETRPSPAASQPRDDVAADDPPETCPSAVAAPVAADEGKQSAAVLFDEVARDFSVQFESDVTSAFVSGVVAWLLVGVGVALLIHAGGDLEAGSSLTGACLFAFVFAGFAMIVHITFARAALSILARTCGYAARATASWLIREEQMAGDRQVA